MRLPDPYRWLEWPLQTWLDWSRADIIGLGYGFQHWDRTPTSRVKPAISMPDGVGDVEQAICQLPNLWRQIVLAEWIRRWPHGYAAKRFHLHRNTHLSYRKHAYGRIAELLIEASDPTYGDLPCAKSLNVLSHPANMGRVSSHA